MGGGTDGRRSIQSTGWRRSEACDEEAMRGSLFWRIFLLNAAVRDELRQVQETTRNSLDEIRRIARARRVELTLRRRPDGVELRIADDGSGLGESPKAPASG